ncbi:hypothetical protein [Actinomadura rugatobispora]|uniref:Lipopolysaccharide biosynthesis protein n=1 Tax=Actinomadura rugatobispora TaxID=1994 RepID=A0ABW1A8J5_9ACTN|nr:hypothetical protein GCM10010200_066950 [Actinomadura rugatobispora]
MTIRHFGGALRRHPVVTLAAVTLTLLLALHVKTARPDYEVRSAITLLSPRAPFPRNAYAGFTPALVTNAEISARTMGSEAGRRQVRAAGGTASYQVLLANRGNMEQPIHDQPHLTVTAVASTAEDARRTHAAVLEVMWRQLLDRQRVQGALPGSLISWQVTAGSGRPVPVTGRPSRRLLAIGLLGAVLTLYAAVAADRRRVTVASRPAAARA